MNREKNVKNLYTYVLASGEDIIATASNLPPNLSSCALNGARKKKHNNLS